MVHPTASCRRCRRLVFVDVPWRGWRVLARVWMGVMVVVIAVSPILIAEITVLLPIGIMIALSGTTLMRMAEEVPRCRRCKLDVSDGVEGWSKRPR
jgi:RNA polymerase subunit RPABC4/transcription elongation factor Spt4